MSGRDPFPSPKFENGCSLSGFRRQQRQTFEKPTHIAQTEEPWSRLHNTATLASTRRSVAHDQREAPSDSLDFHLKSVYDHSRDFFMTKNQMLFQAKTVSEDHRKQENMNQDLPQKEKVENTRVWVDPVRRSIYSIK